MCEVRFTTKRPKTNPQKKNLQWSATKRNELWWTPFDIEWKNTAHPVNRTANWCIGGCWFTLAGKALLIMVGWEAVPSTGNWFHQVMFSSNDSIHKWTWWDQNCTQHTCSHWYFSSIDSIHKWTWWDQKWTQQTCSHSYFSSNDSIHKWIWWDQKWTQQRTTLLTYEKKL